MLRLIRHLRHGLQAKPRVALAVGLGVFAATAAYTFTRPKIYEATASLFLWQHPRSKSPRLEEDDFVRLKRIAESTLMLKRVTDRSTRDVHTVGQAHEDTIHALEAKRRVHADPAAGLISISIRNHDPVMAAELANHFIFEMPYERAREHGLGGKLILTPPPASDAYISPNIPLHLSLGLLVSLALGTTAALLAAHPKPALSLPPTS